MKCKTSSLSLSLSGKQSTLHELDQDVSHLDVSEEFHERSMLGTFWILGFCPSLLLGKCAGKLKVRKCWQAEVSET
jgi:hypothetical protein